MSTPTLILGNNKWAIEEDSILGYAVEDRNGSYLPREISFTRASNGTRINSAGLVEEVPWNLVSQSVWPSIGTGVAPTSWIVGTGPATNFSAGPLAGQLLCNTSANRGFIQQTLSFTAGEYALSVFVDSVTTAGPIAQMISIFGSTGVKYYEDEIGVTSSTSIVAGKRYTVVGTVTTGSFTLRIGSGITGNTTANYVISRPQLNIGSTAKPYFPTTDRLNVPRLTYQNGGGGYPSLLLEKQSTNLQTYSEDFTQWASSNATVTANNTTSPDGTQNADRVQFTGAGYLLGTSQGSGTTYTISCWAKRNGSGTQSVGFFKDGSGVVDSAWALSSDWQRFTYTYTASNGSYSGIAGVNGGDVFVWGAQFEASSYATSYIPTTGSSATRVADACSKTGISSLIGQTEGVLFAEIRIESGSTEFRVISINDGSTSNRVVLAINGQTDIRGFVVYGSTVGTAITTSIPSGAIKIAIVYTATNYTFFVNGSKIGTQTKGSFATTLTNLSFDQGNGGNSFFGQDKQLILFPTPLTDAELAALTTL